jgi:hypothetical protein
MHAYAYAMQMQCNYGAKHLRCYIYILALSNNFSIFYAYFRELAQLSIFI